MIFPKVTLGVGKNGDYLDLDSIRVPGSPSIEELLRRAESKAEKPVTQAVPAFVRLERMLGSLIGIYEAAAEAADEDVKSDLLRAALHKAGLILQVQREIEIDRHNATIQDINAELDELKSLAEVL